MLITNEKIKTVIYKDIPGHCKPRYRSQNIIRRYRMQKYCKIIVQNRVVICLGHQCAFLSSHKHLPKLMRSSVCNKAMLCCISQALTLEINLLDSNATCSFSCLSGFSLCPMLKGKPGPVIFFDDTQQGKHWQEVLSSSQRRVTGPHKTWVLPPPLVVAEIHTGWCAGLNSQGRVGVMGHLEQADFSQEISRACYVKHRGLCTGSTASLFSSD